MGRPSTYTRDKADIIVARLEAGESLTAICADIGMTRSTVTGWHTDDVDGFAVRYAHARECGYHVMAEEILSIADYKTADTVITEAGERQDTEWIARSRLRVDARKWLLSKMLPKVYGDRVHQDTQTLDRDGNPTDPVVPAVNVTISRS